MIQGTAPFLILLKVGFLCDALVIVRDFDLIGISLPPSKTDTKLIIDPDTMLTLSTSFQRLQTVARRNLYVGKCSSTVNHEELSQSDSTQIGWRLPPALAGFPKYLRLPVGEILDHTIDYNDNR